MGERRTRLRSAIKLVLSLGLSGLFLYLAVAGLVACPDGAECVNGQCVSAATSCAEGGKTCVSCVEWSSLSHQLSAVSVWSLILFSIAYVGVHAIRIVRWYFLLRPLGLRTFGPALRAGAIGLAAILIVPLRLGEFVRPYMISRDTHIAMSPALGTAVVERVIDGLCVTLTLFISLALLPTVGAEPAFVWTAGSIAAGVFGSVMTVLMLSWWQRGKTIAVLRKLGGLVSVALTEKAIGLLEGFLDGVATLRHGWNLYAFLFCTVAYWGANGAALAYLASAFGLDVSIVEGIAITSILVIGIMIPGGPGHVGTYEFFLQAGLGLYLVVGEMPDRVLAFIFVIHMLQFLVQIVVALPFWLVDGLSLKTALAGAPSDANAPTVPAEESVASR